ncbi:hypothetical protein KJ596_04805 [Patescibacteria group bacterium]|nr:hypothetical protein [Patescibacteria group bacterium]MBU1868469.1 hypothetical protein [Patescibacteria group bacterium]
MEKLAAYLEWARQNQILTEFIEGELVIWILVSLLFGFFVLITELRLPLEYYWNLPSYIFISGLRNLKLIRKKPVWGYCLDRENKNIIPVAAIELIDINTKKTVQLTYSNRLGQYGFTAPAGQYYVRAVKNYYLLPSILDPENIQLIEIRESYSLPVKIGSAPETAPQINLELQPVENFDPKDPIHLTRHYLKNFIFALGNGFLGLAIALSFFAWAIVQSILYGLFLTVGIILLFIKIYVLETVSQAIINHGH